jgi:hypothetical protein
VFKELFEFGRDVLLLQRDVQKLKEDVARLDSDLQKTNAFVQELAFDLQRANERGGHEHEKLLLKVENALLRYERALPPPRSPKKEK